MATSQNMNTSNQYIKYRIIATEGNYDIASNTSPVNVIVQAWRTNTGYTTYGSGTCYCIIDGVTYSQGVTSSQKLTYNSYTEVFNKTINITHNADGNKTLTISAKFLLNNYTSDYQSFDVYLVQIPRTSSFSLSGNTLGMPISVNISRASSSFTHKVIYRRFDGVDITTNTNVGTSCSFTPAIDDSNYIPNSVSGTTIITVETWYGGSKIGSSSQNLILYVPSYVVPSINDVTISDDIENIRNKFGFLVKNESKLKVVTSASGVYSSTISNIAVNVNGSSYNGSSISTGLLLVSGNNDCIVTITDSRGRQASVTKTFYVEDYILPKINKFEVIRDENTSTNANVSINALITSLNSKNDKSFILKYKKLSDEQYTSLSLDSTSYELNTTILLEVSDDDSYNFILEVKDFFSTTPMPYEIGTSFSLINYGSDGKSIAFGKASEKPNAIEIELDTYYKDKSLDELVAEVENLAYHSCFKPVLETLLYYGSITAYKNTWADITALYSLASFYYEPVRPNYKRWVRVQVRVNDNSTSGYGISVGIFDRNSNNIDVFNFPMTWGNATSNYGHIRESDKYVPLSSIPNDWTYFKAIISNDGNGTTGCLSMLKLQAYDFPNDIDPNDLV